MEPILVVGFLGGLTFAYFAFENMKLGKEVLLSEVCRQSQGYKEIESSLGALIKNYTNYTMKPVEFTINVEGKEFTCTVDLDKIKTENPQN